jgi:hypothetical protein
VYGKDRAFSWDSVVGIAKIAAWMADPFVKSQIVAS